ncbi:Guanosine 5-monophosphate oxidoreductase [Liquorilactobacillus uvarum DSM 19971]|uniref:GMP reductase n=1 Tax=Liquorilactobacillus uvarum DSM 19971 TaxID=1423812 RepID=A0A0R1Q321_9LACO|nr:Guanosine 5-monophosphate oxidoreductase [Liquorilactobacillus uvarum DSM 19971]
MFVKLECEVFILPVFDYEDIQLVPNKCIVKSRSEIDTKIKFGPMTFKIPVVPANMQTIIDEPLAVWLARNGYFYIMHRFNENERLGFVKRMHKEGLFASISVGVKKQECDFINSLASEREVPEYITIDIAHGHAETVIDMIKHIKRKLPGTFVIAGNVGTPEGVRELENAGADATKVGIGPGKACITKLKTGFGTGGWQLAAVRLCSKAASKPIIADGGIRYNGDIAKSVRFGASMCMIGSLFAGHKESPGEIIEKDGQKYKTYFGSASQYQKGQYKNVEGKKMLVPYRGNISNTLREMHEDLQSSISYAGGRNLTALRKVDYVIVKNSIFNGDNI